MLHEAAGRPLDHDGDDADQTGLQAFGGSLFDRGPVVAEGVELPGGHHVVYQVLRAFPSLPVWDSCAAISHRAERALSVSSYPSGQRPASSRASTCARTRTFVPSAGTDSATAASSAARTCRTVTAWYGAGRPATAVTGREVAAHLSDPRQVGGGERPDGGGQTALRDTRAVRRLRSVGPGWGGHHAGRAGHGERGARAVFRDTRLTFKAKRLFGYINTHVTGRQVTVADLVRARPDERDAVRAGLSEVQRHGRPTNWNPSRRPRSRQRPHRTAGPGGAGAHHGAMPPDRQRRRQHRLPDRPASGGRRCGGDGNSLAVRRGAPPQPLGLDRCSVGQPSEGRGARRCARSFSSSSSTGVSIG